MLPRRYSEADEALLRTLYPGGGGPAPIHPRTVVDGLPLVSSAQCRVPGALQATAVSLPGDEMADKSGCRQWLSSTPRDLSTGPGPRNRRSIR